MIKPYQIRLITIKKKKMETHLKPAPQSFTQRLKAVHNRVLATINGHSFTRMLAIKKSKINESGQMGVMRTKRGKMFRIMLLSLHCKEILQKLLTARINWLMNKLK